MASPETSTSMQALPPTPEALHALITTIPPKTLHTYVLSHIATAPPDTLVAFASFFATLAPPPVLHCVRCHVDYTEVENGGRSCRVPHDDRSADVEWVGSHWDTECETHYGCCGKTVKGEGDRGPPDGWCYEGMHTTDTKRARFRADSTPAEDMLDSCIELNCHNVRARLPRAGASMSIREQVARARALLRDGDAADKDHSGSEGTDDTSIVEIAHGVGALGQKGNAREHPSLRAMLPVSIQAPTATNARVQRRTRQVCAPRTRPPITTVAKLKAAATSSTAARARTQTPRAPENDAENSKAGSARTCTCACFLFTQTALGRQIAGHRRVAL